MTVYRNKKTSRDLINRSSTALTQDLTTLTASFQEVYSLSKMEAFQETLTARKANRLNPVEHYPLLPALKKRRENSSNTLTNDSSEATSSGGFFL